MMNPKDFYNETMPEKYGDSYETGRWGASSFQRAQYGMMAHLMTCTVMPLVRTAKRVIEIGPGPGTWTKFLLKANSDAHYILVDISHVMLEQARAALPETVSFIESDWISFAPKEKGDFFFSSRAIEYVPDKDKAVMTIANALSTGGTGIIITKTPKPFFDRLRGRKAKLHTGQISKKELVLLLRKHGFRVMKTRIATATVPLIHSASINTFVYRVCASLPFMFPLSYLSESYAVIFKKT